MHLCVLMSGNYTGTAPHVRETVFYCLSKQLEGADKLIKAIGFKQLDTHQYSGKSSSLLWLLCFASAEEVHKQFSGSRGRRARPGRKSAQKNTQACLNQDTQRKRMHPLLKDE